jgi:phosphatidylglycerophosphate synthase
LIRAAATNKATTRIDIASIPLYAPNRRRDVPLTWALPTSEAEAKAATNVLVAAAQKGCLDWPARFIHPPIENALVRLFAATPVTPNMITLATGVIGIAAGVAFAYGWLWTGLILALITGPLDGVDGKLARTRIEFSKWGDLEHLLDKILEYGWYLAIAGHFAAVQGSALPWAVAALIILPALAEAVQGEFFRRLTGIQLDDAGDVERRIRVFAGRRNTFLWTLLPFAALGLWFAGFVMIAVYSVLTTIVAQWRFYTRLAAYGRDHGGEIAANLKATGYDFLPAGGASPK